MNLSKKENVIIADSQFLVSETVKNLIQEDERFALAGVAVTRQELISLLRTTRNGLLITDLATIDYSGPDDLRTLREEFPQIRVLILTNSLNKIEFLALTRFGIRNIVYKNAGRQEIMTAIGSALTGKMYYSVEIRDTYFDRRESRYVIDEPKNLTASEIEIVRMIASGMTTKEIASKRIISSHTVSTHRKNIFRKIDVSNTSELMLYAIKAGWIENIEYYI